MNSLELLLHKGKSDASSLEKAADFMNTIPRILWLNREVTLEIKNGEFGIEYETPGCGDPLGCCCDRRPPNEDYISCYPNILVIGARILNFAIVDIPASMIASIGLSLKAYVLLTDEKALSYSQFVENLLLKEEYECLSQQIMNEIQEIEMYLNQKIILQSPVSRGSDDLSSKDSLERKRVLQKYKSLQVELEDLNKKIFGFDCFIELEKGNHLPLKF